MVFSLDDKPLEIKCPKCGHKISKTFGSFKQTVASAPVVGPCST